MGTSASQDREFRESVISTTLLEESMEWIAYHLSPEDVYSEEQLARWASENGWKEDTDDR
jgi:hypothetical protein